MSLQPFPDFSAVDPGHLADEIEAVIEQNRKQLDALSRERKSPTWENYVDRLEGMDTTLDNLWSILSHLNSVQGTEETREAYERVLPKLTEYGLWIGQNTALYQRLQEVSTDTLTESQQAVVEQSLREFRLSGVALPEKERKAYADLQTQLSDITNRFSNNVVDCTDAWSHTVMDEKDLAGLPSDVIAASKTEQGYRLNGQAPTFLAVMMHAENRALRETFHRAWVTKAAKTGPHDPEWNNDELMVDILKARQAKSALLGFEHYAAYSIERKMVNALEEVDALYESLIDKVKPQAEAELAELTQFAASQGATLPLAPWDLSFYAEKLKKQKFNIDPEAMRAYFPLSQVLKGLFEVIYRLFGIRIEQAPEVTVYHPDVTCYSLTDATGAIRGHCYFDLYARDKKRGGAWMDTCRDRLALKEQSQDPIAYLVCNFRNPLEGQPSLLSHDEVVTLFHEFGHACHHMLTQQDYPSIAGINGVAWDAVELPSQWLENWCWESQSLALISKHVETGAPLPDDLLSQLKAAKTFQAAMGLLRQIELGLFDWRLHQELSVQSAEDIQTCFERVRELATIVPKIPENRMQNSFTHIFAGGYAAGYYSYLWAEVLAADAFEAFLETHLFDASTGKRFLTEFLEKGASKPAGDLFEAFRGRPPRVDALLRQHGLIPA